MLFDCTFSLWDEYVNDANENLLCLNTTGNVKHIMRCICCFTMITTKLCVRREIINNNEMAVCARCNGPFILSESYRKRKNLTNEDVIKYHYRQFKTMHLSCNAGKLVAIHKGYNYNGYIRTVYAVIPPACYMRNITAYGFVMNVTNPHKVNIVGNNKLDRKSITVMGQITEANFYIRPVLTMTSYIFFVNCFDDIKQWLNHKM